MCVRGKVYVCKVIERMSIFVKSTETTQCALGKDSNQDSLEKNILELS